jgi:nitrogen-specific signal transduction histidine kinase/CheY-like chemotaxis protein
MKLALSVRKNHPREVLPADIGEIVRNCLETGRSKLRLETKMDGRTFSWSFHPMLPGKVVHCYVEDITSRLSLEEQLRQSQKMESVGQLAAGVAHDFNNMLTIIQGHSSSLLAKPSMPEEISDPVQAIYFAAERAASLTRQLLMFSRKNVMQPRPLDLRETVGNMSKMLQRLIGENITLEFHPPAELPVVVGDSGMIEQVVMNLSVNARDAMPRGGQLSVRISIVDVNENHMQRHPEARAGRFVCVSKSDTGTGIPPENLSRIFEPFFTTKEVGKGTGLGLATVYGILKQHQGWVEVESTVGKGTTFRIYIPFVGAEQTQTEIPAKPITIRGGTETILLVEDEKPVRELVARVLERYGYKIFQAETGAEAFEVWRSYKKDIKLVLTDLVMPNNMNGRELAEKMWAEAPGLKVIFTSGYSADIVGKDFKLEPELNFLQKPYQPQALALTIRRCLDGKHK